MDEYFTAYYLLPIHRFKKGYIMIDGITWLLIIMGVVMLASQIYISILLYQYEQSVWWVCIGCILFFGLNVYVYQIIKLEKRTGNFFDQLNPEERKIWRRVYSLVLAQYMLLFVFFGWITSP
jgi:hypothetical protein